MPFGFNDSQYVDLPAIVDEAYIESLQNASGLDFARILEEVDSRLAQFNRAGDPLVAALSSTTREPFFEYLDPIAYRLTPKGEYGMPRPQRGEVSGGYMLPIREWEVAVGWTETGLRRQRLQSIMTNLDGILLGFRKRFRYDAIFRLFSAAEVPVEYGRSTATSPGFAGSGTGLNVYDRPYPSGAALPGGYTHYFRADAAGRPAAIAAMRATLLKQGHNPPYDMIASESQIAAIVADTANFVGIGSALVRQAPDQAEALVDAATYIGVYQNEIRVRPAIDDFSSDNIAVVKLFGALNENNPLKIRSPDEPGLPDNGAALYLRSRNLYPLAEADAIGSWGFGVGNRTAATLLSIAGSGSYVAPTMVAP
jgi:hypothetical protein